MSCSRKRGDPLQTPESFDAIVVGTGQGGKPLAQALAGIFAHPTLAESLNNLFARLEEPAPRV